MAARGLEEIAETFESLDESNYEESIAKCGKLICQMTGDKFQKLQGTLLKYIFSESDLESLFASDLYMFVYRLVHPDYRLPMCHVIMNLCRLAPPHGLSKGAALINRMKNPEVNFLNPKYANVLMF